MVLRTLEDLHELALRLVATLPDGALLLLEGPLGAGKTTLVQAIARAAGSRAVVTSPSYTLIHEVPTPRGLLTHIDAYRLPNAAALFELGLEDYLDRSWLVAVEWGGGLREHLPEAWSLALQPQADGSRRATLTPPESGAVAGAAPPRDGG